MRSGETRPRGCVRDLGAGRWTVRLSLGRDATGKRIYAKRVIRGGAADAQRALTGMLKLRDDGVSPARTRETLDQWKETWLEDHCSDISLRTKTGYADVLHRYLPPTLLVRKLSDLSVTDVQRWVNSLAARGLSPATVRGTHAALRACLSDAVRLEQIVRNPAKGTILPKREHKEMRTLTPTEVQTLMTGLVESPYHALFAVLISTGLRPAELAALRWSDVDLEGGVLQVRRALIYGGKGKPRVVGPTKTGRPRSIPLGRSVLTLLKQHRKDQLVHKMKYRDIYADGDLIFAHEGGGFLHFNNLNRRIFFPLLRSLGLPQIRLYDLRHTMATLLLGAGENVKVVQERLGHSTPVLTLSTYAHVQPGMQAAASSRLDAIMANA